MLIAGDNLGALVRQHDVCPESMIESTSIKVLLGREIFRPTDGDPIHFHAADMSNYYVQESLDTDLTIEPKQAVLASSADRYSIPVGVFGLLSTKGTLARLFVGVHLSDPQIDPGFSGRITMELYNYGRRSVIIPVGANIAQIYLWQCSARNIAPYSGRYGGADGPTLPISNTQHQEA